MPFPRALERRLTGPLGMTDTTFDPRYARQRLVAMSGFGIRTRLTGEVLLRFLARATLPGGGMFSTVGDLLRLGSALLPGGRGHPGPGAGPRILTRRAIEEMSQPQLDGHPAYRRRRDADGRPPGHRLAQAGRGVAGPDRSHHARGHLGSTALGRPEAGFAFASLTNRWDAPEAPAVAILDEVYRILGPGTG